MAKETPKLRFPPRLRIRRQSEFRDIYAKGSRARGPNLTVCVLPSDLSHPRLGLSVGKRCWKRAVRRNRVRRAFREAFRLSQHELPAGVDIVMIASRPNLVPDLEEIRHELVSLTRKALRRRKARDEAPAKSTGEADR